MSDSIATDGERLLAETDNMQRFTATGRPYKPPTKADKRQAALANIGVADTMFGTAPNLQPFRYTDDSLISVPVLKPEDVASYPQRAAAALAAEKNTEKKKFWQSRQKSKDGGLNENFMIKKVPRGEYLKHYAKDDEGRFVGTEEPAADCLLRGPDLEKWRGAGGGILGSDGYRHEVGEEGGLSTGSDDGVIR